MFLKANTKKDLFIHLGIVVAILLVFVFIFFQIYLPMTTHHGEAIKVPDLKGKTLAELDELMDDYNLRYQVNDSTYVVGAVPLSVLSQHPIPGEEVKSNRIIYVSVVSQNPSLVSMPALKDIDLKEAQIALTSRGLILADTNLVPSEFTNVVLKQYIDGKEIPSGTMIPKGSKITLDIGDGKGEPEPVSIDTMAIDSESDTE